MLFNALEFIFVFLPVCLAGLYVLGRFLAGVMRRRAQLAWLLGMSWVFYAAWNPPYLALLAGSVTVNFLIGRKIHDLREADAPAGRWLAYGVAMNLAALAYFKYAGFFLESVNWLLRLDLPIPHILLPLAISFFTFQQIAYLVDCHSQKCPRYSPLEYAFFVSFFPQLIAGPIVHHYEMLTQIAPDGVRPRGLDVLAGASIFLVGLFKKMVLADVSAGYANAVFQLASEGHALSASAAWAGALGFTFQLYFDFSGYSDMAIGLARMCGIVLPLNFNAPYRACDIREFWRRWHMTLSRFLRDYLYIPLGGNRIGSLRTRVNLMLTMLLGGLWHGAGWTFVTWGGLHGLYLVAQNLWEKTRISRSLARWGIATRPASFAITFLAVVVGWVFFRAESLGEAFSLLGMMAGLASDATLPPGEPGRLLTAAGPMWTWLTACMSITLLLPTTQDYFRSVVPVIGWTPSRQLPDWLVWRPGLVHGAVAGLLLFLVARRYFMAVPSEFLYFNF